MNKSKLTLLLILTILSLSLITVSCKSDKASIAPIDESTDIIGNEYQENTTIDTLNQLDDTIVLNTKHSYYNTDPYESTDDYLTIFSDYTTIYTWSQLCSYYGISLDINSIESALADYFNKELTYLDPVDYLQVPDSFSVYKKDDILIDCNGIKFTYGSQVVGINFVKDGTHASPYGYKYQITANTNDHNISTINGKTCYFYEYVNEYDGTSEGYQCTYLLNDTTISINMYDDDSESYPLSFDDFFQVFLFRKQ